MPAFFLTLSQQPVALPSRIAPIQQSSPVQTAIIALIITGALAVGIAAFVGYKQYRRYRFRRKIKTLEQLWRQQKRMK